MIKPIGPDKVVNVSRSTKVARDARRKPVKDPVVAEDDTPANGRSGKRRGGHIDEKC